MKKFFFTLLIICSFFGVRSQTVLNEVYTDPGGTNSEFIELYNSALVGTQSVDCFTILTYWETGTGNNVVRGWHVLDLPVGVVLSKGFYVLAAASPFTTQNTPLGTLADLNWNDPVFRSGVTGGYLKKVEAGAGIYTDVSATIPTNLTDLLSSGSFQGGPHYITLVFVNGAYSNGFVGGGSISLPTDVQNMPDLTVTPAGVCGSAFTVDFSTLGAMEYVGQSGGVNNGYARTSDGKCGAWVKTAPGVNHTPGVTNGTATGLSGALTTSQFISCAPIFAIAYYDITAISGDVTELADFPVEMQLYRDVNVNGVLDAPDTIMRTKMITTVAASGDTLRFPLGNGNLDVFFVYRTKRGCFDKVVLVQQACSAVLPVSLKSFIASRNSSNVILKWETITEENNRGFYIQRRIGNEHWQTVGFVASKTLGGNSNSLLSYQYAELNATKGISQYRLRQMDMDGTPSLSAIRAVRGVDQKGKTIIYPNPSNDGKVNVVFEDATIIRDVSIIDMNGRTIRQWKGITNNTIQIDNLNVGFYTIRIVNNATNEQTMEKVVVNKR